MPVTMVSGTPAYVPTRIRAGDIPSVQNCFGCLDMVTRATPRGTRTTVCSQSGKVIYRTPRCPKWPEGGGA